jgi:hypothetical protein
MKTHSASRNHAAAPKPAVAPDVFDGDIVESSEGVVLSPQERVEIEMRIATAKKYPRNVKQAIENTITMATMSQEIAEDCGYAIARSGKPIQGPSVRLAEIIASQWGNLAVEAKDMGDDDKWVYAQGMCIDLERNYAVRVTARRRITDRNGVRYKDDMIGVTANAALSIAFRNSVFKVVPRVYTDKVYRASMNFAVGDSKAFASKRDAVLGRLKKMGAIEENILKAMDCQTAIKNNETSVDQSFPSAVVIQNDGKPRAEQLADQLAAKLGVKPKVEKYDEIEVPAFDATNSEDAQ